MRNYFILLSLLISCSLTVEETRQEAQAAKPLQKVLDDDFLLPVWKELERKYGVKKTEDEVVAYNKIAYKKRMWQPGESLFYYLAQDAFIAKKAFQLYQDFSTSFADDIYLLEVIENFIYDNYAHLVSDIQDPFELLRNDKRIKPYLHKINLVKMGNFFAKLRSLYASSRYNKNPQVKKVMIITSTGMGGGHVGISNAIHSELQKLNLDVSLVDTRHLNEEDDLMMKVTGQFHSEDILLKIMHGESNLNKAELFWLVKGDLPRFLDDNFLLHLRNRIIQEKPDVILSCIHHRHEILTLSSALKIPTYIVSSDFKLQTYIPSYIHKLDPRYFKILTPITDKSFFEDLIMWPWEDVSLPRAQKIIRSTVSFLADKLQWEGFKSKVRIFEDFGFPVRDQIKAYNAKQIARLKEEYRVGPQEKVLTISMGMHASDAVFDYVDQFIQKDKSLDFKLHLIILAGKNIELKEKIDRYVESLKLTHITVHTFGLLDAQGISNIYNISDLLFSKPGGGTTAEISIVGLPIATKLSYPWEMDNLNYLRKYNMGYLIEEDKDVVDELVRILQTNPKSRQQSAKMIYFDWKKNLRRLLEVKA